MLETSTPILITNTSGTLGDLPGQNRDRDPSRPAFSVRSGGSWRDISASEFADAVDKLGSGLLQAGISAGDPVGIMCRTRYEWTLVDFSLWAIGALPVPIYETSSPEQIAWILQDSGAVAVVVEASKHADAISGIADQVPGVRHTWVIDNGDLDTIAATAQADPGAHAATSRAGLNRATLATIIYTSGTTGRPKGVELSHANFMDLAENAHAIMPEMLDKEGTATLLFLPLAHIFARFVEVLCVVARVRMAHSADITTLLDDFASFKPSFILAVPRVFEKVYNSAEAKAVAGGKGKIFGAAAQTAIAFSEALDNGKPSMKLRAKHAVFDKLVYSKLRDAMGGELAYAVSGGAPLGTRLGHFFRGTGVTILEGYGLTETTAPATVNLPGRFKIGTVGPPLPGIAIRIADDGEVLAKGIGVFKRYYDNEKATAESIRDGWFYTGDLGELDDDGFLRITGRKKEILVTAAGKNVAPAVLEDRLRSHPLVSQCIVVGDARPFIAALITLDADMLPLWAAGQGIEGLTVDAARTHEQVLAAIQTAVDDANKAVSQAESIRKFVILDSEFTEESGHMTPSLKLKRAVIMRDYADDVEALYGG